MTPFCYNHFSTGILVQFHIAFRNKLVMLVNVRCIVYSVNKRKEVKSFPEPWGPWGGADLRFITSQPDTSRSCKTTDTGLVHHVVCPFTPEDSLVLINRPWRDGTLSWRWYTAAIGGIRTRDLAIASPAPYHLTTAYCTVLILNENIASVWWSLTGQLYGYSIWPVHCTHGKRRKMWTCLRCSVCLW